MRVFVQCVEVCYVCVEVLDCAFHFVTLHVALCSSAVTTKKPFRSGARNLRGKTKITQRGSSINGELLKWCELLRWGYEAWRVVGRARAKSYKCTNVSDVFKAYQFVGSNKFWGKKVDGGVS